MTLKLSLHLVGVCLFFIFLYFQYGCRIISAQSSFTSTLTPIWEDDENYFTIDACRNFQSSVVDCTAIELDEFPTWNGDKIIDSFPTVDLYLNFNKISKVVQIKNSSQISKIYFNRNYISDIEPFAFVNLPNLKTLVLSHNQLSIIDPDAFRSMDGSPLSLVSLDLSFNHISRLPMTIFEDLKKLKHLNLSKNKLSILKTSGLPSLNSLVSLQTLNLSRNELIDLPDESKAMVTRVRSLDLSRNSLKRIPEVLRHGKDIKTLIFSKNDGISELDALSFVGLTNVKELEINKMGKLTVIRNGTFTPLTSLEYLSCNSNPKLCAIEGSSFVANSFDGHASLKQVDFSNNNLSTLDVGLFKNIALCEIDLTGNPLKCVCDIISLIQDNIRIEKTLGKSSIKPKSKTAKNCKMLKYAPKPCRKKCQKRRNEKKQNRKKG